MSLQTPSILFDPTVTLASGTAVAWAAIRGLGTGKVTLAALVDAYKTRRTLKLQASLPQKSDKGADGYSQARSSCDLLVPKTLANGKVTENAAGAYIRFDPETTDAEVLALKTSLCSVIMDADLADFWRSQTTG